MRQKMFIIVRNGLAGLLLGGTVAIFIGTSALAADYPVLGGYPSTGTALPSAAPQEPTTDAALLLASRSATLTPTQQPQAEKKSPWWSVFSSKKDTNSSTTPVAPVEPTATKKFKASKADPKVAPMIESKKTKDVADNGQTEVAALAKERQYSEVDYIASATTPQDTKARNLYNEGLLAESQGRHPDAVRAYNGFIKANERSTANGVLAAPYHRLALIAWKEGNVADTEIYFRYALNYALGGNLLIIGSDYAQFLMAKGDYPKAEIILRNTLINDPENKRLLLFLGRCVALQKKHQESLRYLDASVGRAQAYQELAAIYRQQGDFELARVAEEKRNEYLVSSRPAPPAPPAGYSMESMQQQEAMTPPPTAVYPPNSAMGQAAIAVQQQPPYPTLERLPDVQEASTGWVPYQPPPVPPQPTPPAETPVSKVYHYPSHSPSPVYYQYTGNEYPQSPSVHSWNQPATFHEAAAPIAPQAAAPNNVGWNSMTSF